MIAALLAGLTSLPSVDLIWRSTVPEISLSNVKTHELRLEVRNSSSADILIYSSDFWVNHGLVIQKPTGEPVGLTAAGIAAYHRLGSRRRDYNVPILLQPGKVRSYRTPPLPNFYLLEPGEYSLIVRYQDRGINDAPVEIVAKKSKLVVKP